MGLQQCITYYYAHGDFIMESLPLSHIASLGLCFVQIPFINVFLHLFVFPFQAYTIQGQYAIPHPDVSSCPITDHYS